MNKKKYLYIFLMIILMAFLWAAAWVFTKVAVKEIDPFFYTFLRFVFASFFIIPFVIKKLPRNNFGNLFLLSTFAAGNVILLAFGIQYTTALSSSIIYLLTPILVLVLSILFFKNKISKKNTFWMMLWFLWALIVILLPIFYGGDYNVWWLLGNFLIFLAMLSFTIYTIWSKSMQKVFSAETITAWFLFVTLFISWVVVLFNRGDFVFQMNNLSSMAWLSILIAWFLGTWLQYLLQQLVIKKNTSLSGSLFLYAQPVAVAILSVPLLWERITYLFVLGALLALFWVWLSSRK